MHGHAGHSKLGRRPNLGQGLRTAALFGCRDKRDKVDPKDYTIENLTGQVIGRLPGTINGQQFIIQNCQVGELAELLMNRTKMNYHCIMHIYIYNK